MTSADRIEALRTAAGQAGDAAQVAMCDAALAGDEGAVAACLAVCREAEVNSIDVRSWARAAVAGDYLATYWDGESDPGSRCGWSDSELAKVGRLLGTRYLRLEADDRGLRVVPIERSCEDEVRP